MTVIPYLSNVIAQKDLSELQVDDIENGPYPDLIFTAEQLSGERECVVVRHDALEHAANATIEDTGLFTDALITYANEGTEVFFEANYVDFVSAFPFQHAPEILKIGIQIIPAPDGFRFQTLTLLDDGNLLHDPYYMFLPIEGIEAARFEAVSENYSHKIFQAMEVQFPSSLPTPGSQFEKQVDASIAASATLATIGISLLAMKCECEASSEESLPVLQAVADTPRIVCLSLE